MKSASSIERICAAALLIAAGIVIPMFSPLKIVLEPASFTLASHVPIFIAMMISPAVAAAVSVGTAAGFFLGGFSVAVVLRASTHLVFALAGSLYLKSRPGILASPFALRVFSFAVGVIHGFFEVFAVSVLYFYNQMGQGYYQSGYIKGVLLLVGLGTVVHSMADFEIALFIAKVLRRQKALAGLFTQGR